MYQGVKFLIRGAIGVVLIGMVGCSLGKEEAVNSEMSVARAEIPNRVEAGIRPINRVHKGCISPQGYHGRISAMRTAAESEAVAGLSRQIVRDIASHVENSFQNTEKEFVGGTVSRVLQESKLHITGIVIEAFEYEDDPVVGVIYCATAILNSDVLRQNVSRIFPHISEELSEENRVELRRNLQDGRFL